MIKWSKIVFTYLYKDILLTAVIDRTFTVYPYVNKVYLKGENITDLCGEWVFHDLEREIAKELELDDE